MPPNLVLLAAVALIVYLYRRDAKLSPHTSRAAWIPLAWLLLIATRSFAQWCEVLGIPVGGGDVQSGTPLDAAVFFALIIAGLSVLKRRHVTLAEVTRYNRLMIFFLVYCLLACFWSDSTFIALKRWIKVIGHPIMVLVILTEQDPEEAFDLLIKRASYVILIISFVFMKYFPQYGRQFDLWIGAPIDVGICMDKNMLGSGCMISGFFWFCYTLKTWKLPKGPFRKHELRWCVFFLLLTVWVMNRAHSTTSMVTMGVGIMFVVFTGLRFVNPYRIGAYVLAVAVVGAILEGVFSIHEVLIAQLGKDPTLTDRTKVWHDLMQVDINPIVGTGFESFWLGERLQYMWSKWWWHPIQAHNGYIETYLNLGLIGMFFMISLIIGAFQRGQRQFLVYRYLGGFRMGFVLAYVLYNWTEAAFKALHPMWFVFYLVAMDFPRAQMQTETEPAEPVDAAQADTEPLTDVPGTTEAVGK